MSRSAYPHEPPASKDGHKGLTMRLERKALRLPLAKIDRWYEDKKREAKS